MSNDYQKQKLSHKTKIFRYLLPLICLAAVVFILLKKIATLEEALVILRSMPVWIVGLSVIAQVCSYLSSGYLIKVIVDHGQSRLSVARGTLITMAASSIGLIYGWAGYAATTYYWVSKDDDVFGDATLAGVLPSLYNSIVLIIITVLGMLYLLFNNALSKTQITVYGLILVITVAVTLLMLYGLKYREKVERLIVGIAKKMIRLLKRNYDLTEIRNKVDHFYNGMKLLGDRGRLRIGLGPVMNVVFDILTLYLLFIAAGYSVNPSVLIAGYSLAFLMARGAFFIPGGAGLVEGGMVAIYTSLGVPGHISVVAVLSYRFLSFWLPSLLGYAAMVFLQRTSARRK